METDGGAFNIGAGFLLVFYTKAFLGLGYLVVEFSIKCSATVFGGVAGMYLIGYVSYGFQSLLGVGS